MLKKKTSSGPGAAAVGSKPGPGLRLMECDPTQAPSPLTSSKLARHSNGGRPSSSLLLSPRSLPGLSPRSLFSMDAPMSPTSMLEQSKNPPCSCPRNPPNGSGSYRSCGVGSPVTGLAGLLVAGEAEREYCKNSRVLRLRVQLPPPKKGFGGDVLPPSSPIEFGVKNRDSQLALLSPVQRSPLSSAARAGQSEVELAEDYTCVIARGPNPKMTHIFDDRVVESCCGGGDGCCQLSSCYGCKKRLGQGKDALFLQHRGEKAFCSSQCLYQEVLFDKRIGDVPDVSVKLKP